jgi:hypothetical protein
MDSLYFLQVYTEQGGSGLCNQLFTLASGILEAVRMAKPVIAGDFLACINTQATCPLSDVIDVPALDAFVRERLSARVVVIPKRDLEQPRLVALEYGVPGATHDLSQELARGAGPLHVARTVCLNLIKGDPSPGVGKKLVAVYQPHERLRLTYEESEFGGYLTNDLIAGTIDWEQARWRRPFLWADAIDRQFFDKVLKNITFHPRLCAAANTFVEQYSAYDRINVLHIRNERDGIAHWSQVQGMTQDEFASAVNEKYIDLVNKYIDKRDMNIVLTYETNDNPVIEHMRLSGYPVAFVPKCAEDGRECSAIIDLLVGEKCNGVFLGNVHPAKLNGSTFSYVLMTRMTSPYVKRVLVDPDRIRDPEIVVPQQLARKE